MKYAKIINGVLTFPPRNKDNIINYCLNEEMLIEDGYKPIIEAIKPEGHYKAEYVEEENRIVEVWTDNTEEVEAVEKLRIGNLKMTKYDFYKKVCKPYGISYDDLMLAINSNEETKAAWNLCNHVYRGDSLLNAYVKQVIPDMTDEELTEIFEANKT